MKRPVLLFALLIAPPALAAPPAGFDARVEALRQATGVPGMSVAIVEDGHPTFVRGFGVRKLGAPERVDADTIFPTGSTGKAFTVAALATLVDAGRIGWDDRVIDHLPGFEMYDSWVTREITIRDLLVHRSGLGLGEGDLMFVPRSNMTRAEAVRRIRYLKPRTSFRYQFDYDNVLYMVAGQLIEAVTGQTWEDYVRAHILVPAGMHESTSGSAGRFEATDRAFPHARTAGLLRGVGPQQRLNERDELGRAAAPAGGLAISANDFARWLIIQLAHGKLPDGKRLFSEQAHDQMWQPVVIEPITPEPASLKPTEPTFEDYALGWELQDYGGAKIVWHGGAVLGFQSVVVLLPEKNVGFSIEINSEDSQILFGLMYELLDHYLGRPFEDWPANFQAEKSARLAAAVMQAKASLSARSEETSPIPLENYVGTYADPWYGDITVAGGDKGLTIDFRTTPRMSGPLQFWRDTSFIARFSDRTIEPAFITFDLDQDGHVSRVTAGPVSPLADFSYDYQDLDFSPVPSRGADGKILPSR